MPRGRSGGSQRDSNNRGRGSRPPGLRGKEIGLYYARLNRAKVTSREASRPLGSVKLSDAKKLQIKKMLKSNSQENLFVTDNNSYSHVKDSRFKRDFLSIINGSMTSKLSNALTTNVQRPTMDEQFFKELQTKMEDHKYNAMLRKRKNLPSFNKRNELLELIEANQVVVISGETGCGKTTQVSQFILDHYIENMKGSLCRVVCTQPRRISAISVAERVADERAEKLGNSVGFQIRLERKMPRDRGSICFCTTGVVLRQMETDPSLGNVSHLILDEIHERSVQSDFLITILREVIKTRKDIKVILMSATLNSDKFSKYYNNCPHINIPGFTYPVTEYFLEDVLQRTKFTFIEDRPPDRGGSKKTWQRYADKKRQLNEDFVNFVLPYARDLEKEKKYEEVVCRQLKNPKSEELNYDLIFELLLSICREETDNGSILVFLTGLSEITKLNKLMLNSGRFPAHRYIIIPLHSQLPTVEQKQIFVPAPTGKRKIIISTNIAETSITIDDVVYVIDCGKIKISSYDIINNTEILEPQWASLANSDQRRGRAGRVQPGICFHLFSKARHMTLERFQKPEILLKRLDAVILNAKILQLGKAEPFFQSLMDPPEPEALEFALNILKQLDALDVNENLTPLGYHLARLPIAPQMGKMILFGAIFSCLDPVLSIAATLDYKDAFQIPLDKIKEADRKRVQLAGGWLSDHLLFHIALERFETASNPGGFCREYFLSWNVLKQLQNMKNQFMSQLHELNFVSDLDPKNIVNNKNSRNFSLVKAIVCAGLYPNVAIARPRKHSTQLRSMDNKKKYKLHLKSVLSGLKKLDTSLLVYYRKIKSSSEFIHDASMVHPLPIIFFGDQFENTIDNSVDIISINRSLRFSSDHTTAKVIEQLREKLNWFLGYKITHPGIVNWDENTNEIDILRAIMELITSEEIGDIFEDALFDDDNDSD